MIFTQKPLLTPPVQHLHGKIIQRNDPETQKQSQEPEIQDSEPQEPEIQDSESQEPEVQNSESQELETQD